MLVSTSRNGSSCRRTQRCRNRVYCPLTYSRHPDPVPTSVWKLNCIGSSGKITNVWDQSIFSSSQPVINMGWVVQPGCEKALHPVHRSPNSIIFPSPSLHYTRWPPLPSKPICLTHWNPFFHILSPKLFWLKPLLFTCLSPCSLFCSLTSLQLQVLASAMPSVTGSLLKLRSLFWFSLFIRAWNSQVSFFRFLWVF